MLILWALCAQRHVRFAIFITTIKAFLGPTGKKTNPFASKACFLSNRRISRNYQQYRTNYMKICLLMLPGDHGDTVSADKSVPCAVHSSHKSGARFTGVSYVLLSRDVIFACSLLDGKKYLWPQCKWCAGEEWYAGAAVSPDHVWFYPLCLQIAASRVWSWCCPEEAFLSQEVMKCGSDLLSISETSASKEGTQVSILLAVICT